MVGTPMRLAIPLLALLLGGCSCSGGDSGPARPAAATWPLRVGTSDRLALLVGIDDYPGEADDLEGCRRDVRAARELITTRFGFAEEDVRVLLDQQATLAGVLRGFEELLARAEPGAQVLVWYSGHGSRLPDLDGDDPGGDDESWVLWDSRREGREGEWDLPDDALSSLLCALQERTEHVVIVTDCCHSGELRGGTLPPRTRRITAGRLAPQPEVLEAVWPAGAPFDLGRDFRDGPYVHVAACASQERATEIAVQDDRGESVSMGALSYCLTRALSRCAPGTSWHRLGVEVRVQVATRRPMQRPRVLGEDGKRIFGGGYEPVPTSLPGHLTGDRLELEAGHLHGLSPGARVRVTPNLPAGDSVDAELGTARLTRVGPRTSTGRLEGGAGTTAPLVVRAEVIERPPDARPLTVYVAREEPLPEHPLAVEVDDLDAARLVLEENGLFDRAGVQLHPELAGVSILDAIEREWEFQRLRELAEEPGELRVEAWFEQAGDEDLDEVGEGVESTTLGETGDGAWNATAAPNTTGDASADEYLLGILKLRNDSGRKVHVSVLSVADDRGVQVLHPLPRSPEEGWFAASGEGEAAVRSVLVGFAMPDEWPPDRPYLDRYLVIVTAERTDFRFLERPPLNTEPKDARGPTRGGRDSAPPDLVRRAYRTLRGGSLDDGGPEWGVVTLDVRVRLEPE